MFIILQRYKILHAYHQCFVSYHNETENQIRFSYAINAADLQTEM
jgi:hypothetical protein